MVGPHGLSDVVADIHVEVSRVRWFDVTVQNHTKCIGVIENGQI
jgi:hypothetical protein